MSEKGTPTFYSDSGAEHMMAAEGYLAVTSRL